MLDNFIGEFAIMFWPHSDIKTVTIAASAELMQYTKFYRSTMEFLTSLRWESQTIVYAGRQRMATQAFPPGLPEYSEKDRLVYYDAAKDTNDFNSAADYLEFCWRVDLARRVGPNRRETFAQRIKAIRLLHQHATLCEDKSALAEKWNRQRATQLSAVVWSPEQQLIINTVAGLLLLDDAQLVEDSNRKLFVEGDPGTGKSEVLVHMAHAAAIGGAKVLVLCPTGTLVHAYRERIPEHPNITIETLHSGLSLKREYDKVVDYCPPGKLRKYDLIILDEASQIDSKTYEMLRMAIAELPQRPVLCVAADWRQLNPIKSSNNELKQWCESMQRHMLTTSYRTKDPKLLDFLKTVRTQQPQRTIIAEFFRNRRLGNDLQTAVKRTLDIQKETKKLFTWLTVSEWITQTSRFKLNLNT